MLSADRRYFCASHSLAAAPAGQEHALSLSPCRRGDNKVLDGRQGESSAMNSSSRPSVFFGDYKAGPRVRSIPCSHGAPLAPADRTQQRPRGSLCRCASPQECSSCSSLRSPWRPSSMAVRRRGSHSRERTRRCPTRCAAQLSFDLHENSRCSETNSKNRSRALDATQTFLHLEEIVEASSYVAKTARAFLTEGAEGREHPFVWYSSFGSLVEPLVKLGKVWGQFCCKKLPLRCSASLDVFPW